MAASNTTYEFLDAPSEPGDMGTLGHYRVIDELGKGGMGNVFRAEDIKLKRSVALKVMNQKIAATPNSRRRFIHEARAMAAVHHDNVAVIFEVGESNNTPFMAMEMLKGSTLETFNKTKTKLGFEQVIDYARQITRGLGAAHAQGIVHRDIKPANIWLEEGNNRIKILDFGLALASTPVDHLSGRGAVIGTPGYLSPEQARSEPLDDRSDLYSLGVVLYELCTCKLPIQAKSVPGQLISILAHRPTPINELNPDIPQPLCDLIHRLLRKEPRTRPSSAVVLEQELDRVEQECHAKSEVAQAINKLQMGLSEVVSNSANDALFDVVEEVHEPMPDPLAAIPAAAPVTMVPPARPGPAAQRATPPPAAPAWQAYLPLAGIAALVLIALPILTYSFSGAGRGNTAYVIAHDGNTGNNGNTGANNNSGNQNRNSNSGNNSGSNSQQNKWNNNKKKWNNKNQNGSNQNNQNSNGGQGNQSGQNNQAASRASNNGSNNQQFGQNNQQQDNQQQNNQQPMQNEMAANDSPPATPEPDMVAVNKPPADPEPPVDPTIGTEPPMQEPVDIPMTWTELSSGTGRGADSMVQRGATIKAGLKPSFGIGSRNGVEMFHSYLRFDLADLQNVKNHVDSAELLLTFLGGNDVEVTMQVYGIADVGVWPEQKLEWKNSYSSEGLDRFPLLVTQTLKRSTAETFDGRKVARLSSPELANFIKVAEGETITFVLSGTGPSDEALRFVSRENAKANRPPILRLNVPVNPPEPPKNKRKNRG